MPPQVDPLRAHAMPVDERVDELRIRPGDREDRAVVIRIRVDVEHVRVRRERVRSASIVSTEWPSEKFGTASSG